MPTPLDLIRARVASIRGGYDAPGFEACIDAEVNERLEKLSAAVRDLDVFFRKYKDDVYMPHLELYEYVYDWSKKHAETIRLCRKG